MLTPRSPIRSRSVTSLSAVVRNRRSEATGCRRASTCMQSSSMAISSWLILRSAAIPCSASSLSRSMSARMLPLMMSSTLAPMSRSCSRRRRSSSSYSRLVCSRELLLLIILLPVLSPESARDVVFRPGVTRFGEQHVRAIELDQLAQIEERRVIGHPRRLLHVVGDDDDRVVLGELVDQLLDVGGGDRIEGRGRLVHQQHLRLDGQRARDAEPLLLSAREAERAVVEAVLDLLPQRGLRERSLDAGRDVARVAEAADAQAVGD